MLPEGTLAELIDNIIYRGSCTFVQPKHKKSSGFSKAANKE